MKKSVMLKWIKALRSNKYNQTKEYLKNSKGYCCLGVLCDISKKGNWDGSSYEISSSEGDTECLPNTVRIWAGMKETDGALFMGERTTSLANLNDEGQSFKQIANIIKKHWKEL